MRTEAMDRWAEHCCHYFEQPSADCTVLHPTNHRKLHIDMLLFPPNEIYPFWKLATMGASDYKLPLTFCRRNEFVMFISEDRDLRERETLTWYCDVLLSIALYPAENHIVMTAGHSIIWGRQEGTDMFGAFLSLPFAVKDTGFHRCSLGFSRETFCLQATLLTEEECKCLVSIGTQEFFHFLQPQGQPAHFLSQRYRSQTF